jgi:hypothetical protein
VTEVYIESGNKRVFACAYDWPGWCRSAKDEAGALDALGAYASRYAPVARRARLPFDPAAATSFRVVERIKGSANTDFGVPHEIAKRDTDVLRVPEAERLGKLVIAAWKVFDDIVRKAPAQLRKGPRGGGRDRDQIVEHVVGAESSIYARKLGLRLATPGDTAEIKKVRKELVDALARPSNGAAPVERGWPQRYAARRIAWHVLDHAWEIQDRSST